MTPTLPGSPSLLRRLPDGAVLLPQLHLAESAAAQRRGLLGFTHLPEGAGLFFRGVRIIHTFFMKMPLDVAFLSPEGVVKDIHPGLPPWRVAFCREPGRADALETAAGVMTMWNLQPGDQLEIQPI